MAEQGVSPSPFSSFTLFTFFPFFTVAVELGSGCYFGIHVVAHEKSRTLDKAAPNA